MCFSLITRARKFCLISPVFLLFRSSQLNKILKIAHKSYAMISSNPFKGGKKEEEGKVGMRKRFLFQRRSPTEPPANPCFVERLGLGWQATVSSSSDKEQTATYVFCCPQRAVPQISKPLRQLLIMTVATAPLNPGWRQECHPGKRGVGGRKGH